MDEQMGDRFEADRARLRAVAYRLLGSFSEADDAVQEAWLRLNRSDVEAVNNLSGWLTTVVARVCLDVLRARGARREEPLGIHVPDPVVTSADVSGPEDEAVLADSVGLALLVVLDILAPAERLAFVLHDMFDIPFREIAPMLDRSPNAAKLLAGRARRRVRGTALLPDTDLGRQREVVDAFFAASRDGDINALAALLDPDVVVRADYGTADASRQLRGAGAVAPQALRFSRRYPFVRPVVINGGAGAVVVSHGQRLAVMAFAICHGRITEIDVLADHARLHRLYLPSEAADVANHQSRHANAS